MLRQSRSGRVKQRFLEAFRPYLDFQSEIKSSAPTYFALGYVEAVYKGSVRLTNYEDAGRWGVLGGFRILFSLSEFFSYKQCTSFLLLFQRNKQTHEVDGMKYFLATVPFFSQMDRDLCIVCTKKLGYVYQPPVGPENPPWFFFFFFFFLKEFLKKNQIKGWSSEGKIKLESSKSRK